MVWVDAYPTSSIALAGDEPILKLIRIPHTPLIGLLTKSSLLIYNQRSLLLVAHHIRTDESLQQHGENINVKCKYISVNSAQLQQLAMVNLFVETDLSCLVIYQVMINYSKSLYEVHNKQNDELLQTGLPLSFTSHKFSLVNMIKSATKTLMQGNQVSVNLENIEHFNNCSIEDELSNFKIGHVKLSVYKILKIGIGISKYWIKQNSHNVLLFNDKNEKCSGDHAQSLPENDSYFQLINIKNFKNEVFQFSELEWYDNCSKVMHITFNYYQNFILLINDKCQIWYMKFEQGEDFKVKIVGSKVFEFDKVETPEYKISFNPQFDLVLIRIDRKIKLFKFYEKKDTNSLEFVKDIDFEFTNGEIEIHWSPCGKFFVVFNKESGYWSIYSKFGNNSFSSFEILNEANSQNNADTDPITNFLKISSVLITSNSSQLILMNKNKSHLYLVDLLSLANQNHSTGTSSDLIFYNNEYISILSNYSANAANNFIRFPMLPIFKDIFTKIENFNGSSSSVKYPGGQLRFSSNIYKQISVTYGDHVAVSTPYNSGHDVNQILWFNFRNYYVESLNVIEHFWFDDYLILFNRTVQEDNFVDEIMVMDTSLSKFGHGGTNFNFDSDLIIWKHSLDSKFICYELGDREETTSKANGINLSKNLMIVTDDKKIIIFELSKYESSMLIKKRLQSRTPPQNSDDQDDSDVKNYKIFIGLSKTVHLNSIQDKLAIADISQVSMMENAHFLLLLNNGDLFLLKNYTSKSSSDEANGALRQPSNMYELIKIKGSIEYYQLQSINYVKQNNISYLYLFNGETLLIYNLLEMIESAFGTHNRVPVSIDDSEPQMVDPITIAVHDFQPLVIKNTVSESSAGLKSIDLIGLESISFYKNNYLIVKNKMNHKLILNNFIEYDVSTKFDINTILHKYHPFDNFDYCLELLLFNYLTSNSADYLSKIIELINHTNSPESIYINCLRKIEIAYWQTFFEHLKTTPTDFMNKLIEIGNVELCYNYLIIYLNFKKEHEDTSSDISLDSHDTEIILKIIKMLDKSQKWDWCFELCRFIKLLEPSGNLLKQIEVVLK
ncbi:DEHA2D08756p [Debaryomyces hansenii CBS767]|uniref:DEHA2D08756p n=1 Tax=Debaryomyces hansenii (strain ATCC 36239 / CBS 767 / BCRC 21394 / JCM 1990 / NBRC 0083 / IGC 2968) TaxID=284592 RepID=Q6BSH6_DEBHA|nr:DEHA2D08756p [Debaryomyces hansenii CBS767]CAG86995.2 DEHA2D08756p [Debaryomyces hansenii CBS767]|eukprot:XP_458844.2 DEHA2D08756p [Debaryomyces hansenii CBS767]